MCSCGRVCKDTDTGYRCQRYRNQFADTDTDPRYRRYDDTEKRQLLRLCNGRSHTRSIIFRSDGTHIIYITICQWALVSGSGPPNFRSIRLGPNPNPNSRRRPNPNPNPRRRPNPNLNPTGSWVGPNSTQVPANVSITLVLCLYYYTLRSIFTK